MGPTFIQSHSQSRLSTAKLAPVETSHKKKISTIMTLILMRRNRAVERLTPKNKSLHQHQLEETECSYSDESSSPIVTEAPSEHSGPRTRGVSRTSSMDEVACRMARDSKGQRKGISFSLSPRKRPGVARTRSTDDSAELFVARIRQKASLTVNLDEDTETDQTFKTTVAANKQVKLLRKPSRRASLATRSKTSTPRSRPTLNRGGAFKTSKSSDASAYVSSRFLFESTKDLMEEYDSIVVELEEHEEDQPCDSSVSSGSTNYSATMESILAKYHDIESED